jgi:hypothetical protein
VISRVCQEFKCLPSEAQRELTRDPYLVFDILELRHYAQMRDAWLRVEEMGADVNVAWYDIGVEQLVVLPQIYRRIDAQSYAYDSPTADYRATLEIAPSGFVRLYPDLWVMENS